jgi:hypothetical protein
MCEVHIYVALQRNAEEGRPARRAVRSDPDFHELPVVGEARQVVNLDSVVDDGVRVTLNAMSGLREEAGRVALRLVDPEHTASPGQQRQCNYAGDAADDDEGDASHGRASLVRVYRHGFDSLG